MNSVRNRRLLSTRQHSFPFFLAQAKFIGNLIHHLGYLARPVPGSRKNGAHQLLIVWYQLEPPDTELILSYSPKKFSSSSTLFGSAVKIWRRPIASTRFSW